MSHSLCECLYGYFRDTLANLNVLDISRMHVTGNGAGQGLIAVKEKDTTTCVFVDKQICKALLTHQEEKDEEKDAM